MHNLNLGQSSYVKGREQKHVA